MNILLDTHIALWLLAGSSKTPAKVLQLVLNEANSLYVSDISLWEIAIKHQAHPNQIPGDAASFASQCDAAGFKRQALTRQAVFEYEQLSLMKAKGVHKDPFDRMLIAQARANNLLLITHDAALALYDEPNVLVL